MLKIGTKVIHSYNGKIGIVISLTENKDIEKILISDNVDFKYRSLIQYCECSPQENIYYPYYPYSVEFDHNLIIKK